MLTLTLTCRLAPLTSKTFATKGWWENSRSDIQTGFLEQLTGAALGLGKTCKKQCNVEGLKEAKTQVSEERPSDSDLCKDKII